MPRMMRRILLIFQVLILNVSFCSTVLSETSQTPVYCYQMECLYCGYGGCVIIQPDAGKLVDADDRDDFSSEENVYDFLNNLINGEEEYTVQTNEVFTAQTETVSHQVSNNIVRKKIKKTYSRKKTVKKISMVVRYESQTNVPQYSSRFNHAKYIRVCRFITRHPAYNSRSVTLSNVNNQDCS